MDANLVKKRFKALELQPRAVVETIENQIEMDSTIGDYDTALAFLLLGRGYLLLGRQDEAIGPLNRALHYLEEKQYKNALFQCLVNLGVVYRESKELYLALDSFNKACDLSYELDDFTYVISALIGIASCYIELGQHDMAKKYFEKALEYKNQVQTEKILGDLYNNYAYLLLEMNRWEESLAYFELSKAIYDKAYPTLEHINCIIVRMNIGELQYKMGDYKVSQEIYENALQLSLKENINFLIVECYLYLSRIYQKIGAYAQALELFKKYIALKEEVATSERFDEIKQLKEKLAVNTKKNQDEIHLLRNVALKNKTNTLEKTLKNLSNITEVGRLLIASTEMHEIFKILKNSIHEWMPSDVFGLALYDSETEVISYKYFEEQGKMLPLLETPIASKRGLATYAILNDTDIFVKNFDVEYPIYMSEITRLSTGDARYRSKSLAYCRLISENTCIGLITMQSYDPNHYSAEDFEVFRALASYVAIAISNAQKKSIIQDKAEALEYLSYNDPLTGLQNRRSFNKYLEELQCIRPIPVGVMVGDMNNLKRVNDTMGHLAGDAYLIRASSLMQHHAKPHHVFRLGGDEFAIIVPNATREEMIALQSDIQASFEESYIHGEVFSISLGIALWEDETEDIHRAFSEAESAMYAHKKKFHLGRSSDKYHKK